MEEVDIGGIHDVERSMMGLTMGVSTMGMQEISYHI